MGSYKCMGIFRKSLHCSCLKIKFTIFDRVFIGNLSNSKCLNSLNQVNFIRHGILKSLFLIGELVYGSMYDYFLF